MRLENYPVRFIFLGKRRLNKSDDLSGQGASEERSTTLQNFLQLVVHVHSNPLHFTPFCITR